MADEIRHVTTEESAPVERPINRAETVQEVTEVSVSPGTLIARIIWFIAGILLAVLGIRFILALLGANTSNGFANFIYSVSHPFVAPFFSLFGYNLHYGASRFEGYTLVAMLIYALIAYGIVRLLTIGQPDRGVSKSTHTHQAV